MTDQDYIKMRQVYYDAWHKFSNNQPLSALEAIIADIIQRHPEYHPLFSSNHFAELQLEKFALDHNPFFHLALHVTIAEQVGADRPTGVRAIYFQLLKKHNDQTAAEHVMLDCLTNILIASQANNTLPNDSDYLEALKKL